MRIFTKAKFQPPSAKNNCYIGRAYFNPIILQAVVTICLVTVFFIQPSDNAAVKNGHCIIIGAVFLLVTIYNCYDTTVWYYYGVSEEGLNEYHFFRYVRTIPWEQIIQVGIQRDIVYVRGRLGLIVTLQGAPKWNVNKRRGSRCYWRRNRPNVLFIWDSKKALPVIEKHYGQLDYS